MKKKSELKKIISITINPKQHRNLQKLAKHTGSSLSETIRELLPCPEEIEAFKALQNYRVKSKGKSIAQLITKSHGLYFGALMSIYPNIALQAHAVLYLQGSTGIFKLYQNFIKALRRKKGYKFVSEKLEGWKFKIVTSPKESKVDIQQLISRYVQAAPGKESLTAIELGKQNPTISLLEQALNPDSNKK